jgi:hypothetical protein
MLQLKIFLKKETRKIKAWLLFYQAKITDRQLMQTKYLDAEESQKPWRNCTSVRSPYIRGKLCYKTEFEDGSVSFSETFDPDDPSLMDRHPEYDTDTHLGDRPPTQ